jgi:hypothetical protein
VFIGLGLAVFYFWEATTQPDFDVGIHFLLVLLILFTARQNLRQYYYAKILEKLISGDETSEITNGTEPYEETD